MKLQPGTLLQGDRYRIIDVLGQGGFGITYLAEQVMAERKVCIKEFFPKEYYNRNEDSRSISLGSQGSAEIMELYKAKFIKEAKTIAKLDHPNIIHIHDVFAENNTAYYVMEYIDGESLSALVKSRGVLPESEAISYIKQVAAALGSIHEQRIMHLDIKPANIMLRKNEGKPVLIDFGLSKQYDAEGNQTSSTPVGISAGYAPMEQYQQGGVREFSPETDIYSLGATLYYLVTGVVPPQAAAIVDDGLPELPAHLSANVRNAIERSMEVQRKRRPHSIKEFLALLEDNNPVVVPIPKPTPAPVSEETAFGAPASNAADERTAVGTTTPKAQPTPQPKKEWVPKYAADKPKKSEETKNKSKWWLWLLIIVVVAIGGYLALSSSNDSETAKSEQVQNRQAEEAEKARIAEEQRQAEEAEKARIAEEQRQAEETEKARKAEEKRKAEEAEKARKAEEQRQVEEAEKARKAEEKRINDMVAQGLGRDGVYQIGDYYNRDGKKGVVFDVWDGGRQGKIVSLDETKAKWVNADVWCRNKGVYWYLPTTNELISIHLNIEKVNSTLGIYGIQLQSDWYWTCTTSPGNTDSEFCRQVYKIIDGPPISYGNNNAYIYVRAVATF